MVQATSPGQSSGPGSQGGFRVGASHDGPTRTGTTPVPAGRSKLPPIEWSHADFGKIMRQDLAGLGRTVAVLLLGMTVFIVAGMGIAMLVTTILNAVGFDPSSSY